MSAEGNILNITNEAILRKKIFEPQRELFLSEVNNRDNNSGYLESDTCALLH